ncbi:MULTISPECIES: envelope stress response membrane protein PspB [Solimonas]|uniref:envelope stress response membrane protein PspB n=1 Tax=Solimonas TaxID=413435 RepID=UPI0003A27B45|nr:MULTISPECIES: envelope stress response membrane protein PspB [Solimonas]
METFFENLIPLIAVTGIFIVIPLLVFRAISRRRELELQHKTVAGGELVELADRLEKRIDTLERLLDVEAPGWRQKHHDQH